MNPAWLAVAFEGPGRRTSMFVSTHLCHLSEPNRLAQVETLEKLVADFDGLVILAGDLNARPASAPMQALLEDWRNPLEDEQRSTTFSSVSATDGGPFPRAKLPNRSPRIMIRW